MELTANALQSFLPPSFLDKIGGIFGISREKVTTALMAAAPAVFDVIKQKSATVDGAKGVMEAIRRGGFDSTSIDQLAADPLALEAQMNKGQDLMASVLGGKTNSITQNVAAATGVNTSIASKLVGAASATVLSYVGSKMKLGSWSPAGLASALGQLSFLGSSGTQAANARYAGVDEARNRRMGWAIAGLAALAALAWGLLRQPKMPAVVESAVTTVEEAVTVPVVSIPAVMNDISQFLADPNIGATPRTFSFGDLNFATNSAALSSEAEGVVASLGQVMERYPNARIRIVGHTDNVGSAMTNQQLSLARANSLRAGLIDRGVAAARIEAVGVGAANPVADNDTDAGRAQNRRTDVEVIGR